MWILRVCLPWIKRIHLNIWLSLAGHWLFLNFFKNSFLRVHIVIFFSLLFILLNQSFHHKQNSFLFWIGFRARTNPCIYYSFKFKNCCKFLGIHVKLMLPLRWQKKKNNKLLINIKYEFCSIIKIFEYLNFIEESIEKVSSFFIYCQNFS